MTGASLAVISIVVAGVCAGPAAALGSPTITDYVPGFHSGLDPAAVAVGPDGNLWVTEDSGSGGIAVVTPTGTLLAEYRSGFTNPPQFITAGPNGNMWFTESGAIGKITPSGTVTQYTSGLTSGDTLLGITEGPDGNIWFTEDGSNSQIGRISPTGTITDFGTGLTSNSDPWEITPGPDGKLWFTEENNAGAIGQITTGGVITQFSTGLTSSNHPTGITAGPDGNIWFTESGSSAIVGRITTSGTITEFPISGAYGVLRDIAAGDDGNLYFTESDPGVSSAAQAIGQITTSGTISQYTTGLTSNAQPWGIASGPDGNVWFSEPNAAGVGRITLAPGASSTSATNVAEQTATLNADVSANAQTTTYSFQYGTTTSYGSVTSSGAAGSGDSATSVSSPLTNLLPGSLYHFRVVATNATGTSYGPDQTFSTIAAPTANSDPATMVTLTGAVLNADVNPEGQSTTYHFNWGTSDSYGQELPTSDAVVGAQATDQLLSQTLTGLAPGTTYHYQVVATNCGGCVQGTTYGPDQTFETIAASSGLPTPQSGSSAPQLGRSVNVSVLSGRILVKMPGSSQFKAVSDAKLPTGTVIDTRSGAISLTSALRSGGTQSATLRGGMFTVMQSSSGTGMTDFVMSDRALLGCRSNRSTKSTRSTVHAAVAARKKRRPKPDSLWATDDDGQFSTRGYNSVAVVRGTAWLTVDSCAGTLTKVTRGVVAVLNLHTHRTVVVRAGHSYLARARTLMKASPQAP